MIAISYRREDTAPITGRIYDRLQAIFSRDRVFMDLDSIPFGIDFRTHISESLDRCHTLLVVIGPRWLGVSPDGSRRIDDPTDFVRLEVAQALARNIRVIPLLIDRTEMPSSSSLPEDLKSLAFRNALRVDSGADFHHHINRLCSSLESTPSNSTPTVSSSPQPVTSTSSPPLIDTAALFKILPRLALCILILSLFWSLGVGVGDYIYVNVTNSDAINWGVEVSTWLFGIWLVSFLWRRNIDPAERRKTLLRLALCILTLILFWLGIFMGDWVYEVTSLGVFVSILLVTIPTCLFGIWLTYFLWRRIQ
jgi:hypothetical protein